MDRAEVVHQNFRTRIARRDFPPRSATVSLSQSGLSKTELVEIFESQLQSRQLDRAARQMQARGEGFYTIGSSGHEGNAAIAAAFRVDDMAFLHYRDAAFLIQRSKRVPQQSPLWDILLSFSASAEDPISGGRHKVLGSKSLFIPPQTSTIASHLPKAVGTAYSIGLANRLQPQDRQLADDGVVLCSFGDASVNHSTAQGAFNTASWTAYQGAPMPLVFICEDNGIGISTKTPPGWIAVALGRRPALRYLHCDGLDILDTYRTAREAEAYVRRYRKPVFLHMQCVRLYGHAGADLQTAYLSAAEIEVAEGNDPLLHSARLLIEEAILSADQVLARYDRIGEHIRQLATRASQRPRLETSTRIRASLIPPKRQVAPSTRPNAATRASVFGTDAAALTEPQPMARLIGWALTDLMLEHDNIVLAGEDIGPKGGVYNVTSKLYARFGPNRVINTLLDEQSILGLAIGLAHNGFLPIPEIQFLAYLHNAEDQLRGEAATLSFFSKGQYTNPVIIRIAGLGYQKGFGGHFHNDNSLAVIRDIPGVIIACPSNGADAVSMLRECVRLAREEQRVIVFIEPIALYAARDLHGEKDGLWKCRYPPVESARPLAVGDIGQYGEGTELALVTYGNGYYLCRQAEKILAERHGVSMRIIDLRWLAPVAEGQVLAAIEPCEHVLIVDECRTTGSQSEALMTLFTEKATRAPKLRRLAADDCFIPLGPAASVPLPGRDAIITAALELLARP